MKIWIPIALLAACVIGYAVVAGGAPAGEKAPAGAADPAPAKPAAHPAYHAHSPPIGEKLMLSEDEWKKKLSPHQYRILRESGTEFAGTGKLLHNKEDGTYRCGGCGAPLFDSETKYTSGSGWPSFYAALEGRIVEKVDTSHGMVRTELLCARCGGHLGHKFSDGPKPTGQRYCINSASLEFQGEDGRVISGE